MRKVLIGTPMMDGKATARYIDAFAKTLLGAPPDIAVDYLFVTQDALVQRARTDIFVAALRADVDDLVFIDADQVWEPAWFYALLAHPVDVVGMTYPKKADVESYPVKCVSRLPTVGENGLILVDGLGTGFLRLTRKALRLAWERGIPYKENGIDKRWVFDVGPQAGDLVGEDIFFCDLVKELGVYLDPRFTLPHVGEKVYTGNVAVWLSHLVQFEQGRRAAQAAGQPAAQAAPGLPATLMPPAVATAPIQPGKL
jgi:hypothetical protein